MKYNYAYTCHRRSSESQQEKSDTLKLGYRLLALIWTLMLTMSPAFANVSLSEEVMLTRQNNVRRLRLLNQCVGCELSGVTLTNAQFVGADLRNANLSTANLAGSDLTAANLTGADLTGANLTGALLFHTNLSDAYLDWVNFSYAQLDTVNVVGATTQNINLTGAQLENTFISIGGEESPIGAPLEPTVPFENTKPPDYRY